MPSLLRAPERLCLGDREYRSMMCRGVANPQSVEALEEFGRSEMGAFGHSAKLAAGYAPRPWADPLQLEYSFLKWSAR